MSSTKDGELDRDEGNGARVELKYAFMSGFQGKRLSVRNVLNIKKWPSPTSMSELKSRKL